VEPEAPTPTPGIVDPLAPRRWVALTRAERVKRALAITFTVFAICGAVFRLFTPQIARQVPEPVQSAMRYWHRTLAGAGRWDMFVTPPRDRPIAIEGRLRRGRWFDLVDPLSADRGLWRRVVDARLRKWVQKFSQRSFRKRYARPYLDWVCRTHEDEHPDLRSTRIVQRPHPYRDGPEVRAKTLVSHRCGDPFAPAKASPPPRTVEGEGL
jgi:hypothetical protein